MATAVRVCRTGHLKGEDTTSPLVLISVPKPSSDTDPSVTVCELLEESSHEERWIIHQTLPDELFSHLPH